MPGNGPRRARKGTHWPRQYRDQEKATAPKKGKNEGLSDRPRKGHAKP